MNNIAIMCGLLAVASFTTCAFAEEAKPEKKYTAAEIKAIIEQEKMVRYGGRVEKANSASGAIYFFNAQKVVPTKDITAAYEKIKRDLKLTTKFEEIEKADAKTASDIMSKFKADVGVFVVDCDCPTTLLTAPDQNWAVVNVRKVVEGAKDDAAKARRVRIEMLRAFAMVGGAVGSQYATSILDPMKDGAALDSVKFEAYPPDVSARFVKYLEKCGIRPQIIRSYKRACEEGWAPAPTNDAQRAIWNKVHQLPDKPIKIEFDPKRDK